MNQSHQQSSNEETNKTSIILSEQMKMITCFETLSNELFHEIFDYLDGCKLYEAFSNLNSRFEALLDGFYLPLKIRLLPSLDTHVQHRYMNVISQQKRNIISLHLSDPSTINLFFTLMTFESSFHRLESLGLIDIERNDLLQRLPILISLPQLFSFTLSIKAFLTNLSDIYRMIFQLPKLKHVNISCEGYGPFIPLSLATNNQCSPITHLEINHSCRINDLLLMLVHTPELRYLFCLQLINSNENVRDVTVSLPKLRYISIRRNHLRFDQFEMFMKTISCELRVLRTAFNVSAMYLDADRWEKLVSQNMPYLRRFHFQHEQSASSRFDLTEFYNLINRFNSQFWIERQWIAHLLIYIHGLICKEMIFSIDPYKNEWDKLSDYITNDTNYNKDISINQIYHVITSIKSQVDKCFIETCSSIEIMIDCFVSAEGSISFLRNIRPIAEVMKVTHLNIRTDGFSIGTFLKLLLLLPNLNSLKISNLSLIHLSDLRDDELESFHAISATNKITKVVFEKMSKLVQVQFIIHLCPAMRYFEIHCSSDVDLELLVHCILVENFEDISHLCVLCLDISIADNNMIDTLEQLTQLKEVHYDYRVSRVGDKIYLQRI